MADDDPVALVGGTLIDGSGKVPLSNATVLIQGDRIVAAGPAGSIDVPATATVVSTAGKTVMPGLIEAHMHLGSSGGGTSNPEEFKPRTVADNLKSFLAFGVTSIMDMGPNPFLDKQKAELESGALMGPRLFGVKYGITAPGSHPRGLLKRFKVEEMLGGHAPVVDTVEEAREVIRRVADDRPDGVKIYHTRSEFPGDMCLDADKEKLKPAVLEALIDEAHKRGLRTFAHIAFPSEAREAVAAGIDVLAHPITHAETATGPIFEAMAERGVYMHSTIVRVEAYYGLKVDPFMLDKLRGKVSPVVLESIPAPGSVARLRHDTSGVTGDARRIQDITMANVRRALKAGVRIVMGTDSGAPGGIHGASVPREMELLTESGLTPMQAIVAATRHAAEVIGQGDALGRIEPGMLADVIVIDGDPLRDIAVMRNVSLVIRNGEAIDPKSIKF